MTIVLAIETNPSPTLSFLTGEKISAQMPCCLFNTMYISTLTIRPFTMAFSKAFDSVNRSMLSARLKQLSSATAEPLHFLLVPRLLASKTTAHFL